MYQLFTKIMLALVVVLPGTASMAQLAQPYEMTVDGVKVIVQPSGNDILVIQTIIKGGVQNYTAAREGIETMAFTALTECGTAKDDKNSFKNKLNKIDARIGGASGMDYASFTMNCIKSDFETVWPLYTDALLTPAFNEHEFDRIKQVAINRLKQQDSNPDQAISNFAKKTSYAGKDYAKLPGGTEASISALTAAETKAYYKSILTRSKMTIVVVGEVEKQSLEKKIADMLRAVPAGKPFTLKKEMFSPSTNSFVAQKKDFATNYIQGISSAPQPGTPDYNAFVLAMRIFSDRQFLEVRTKNGLSYAPYSYFDGGLSPSSNLFVSTTDPDKYIGVMNQLINSTRKNGFKDDEVKDVKSTYVTAYFYRLETNAAQAAALATNEVLHNDWRRALTINDEMAKLTKADLNRVFNKYVNHIAWVYMGDPAKVNPALYGAAAKPKTPAPVLKEGMKN